MFYYKSKGSDSHASQTGELQFYGASAGEAALGGLRSGYALRGAEEMAAGGCTGGVRAGISAFSLRHGAGMRFLVLRGGAGAAQAP